MLLPEHEEQQGCIHIADIEVILAVSACEKHSGETEDCRQQIYQQHRLSAEFKKYRIPEFHSRPFLTYRSFKRHLEKFLRLDCELHRKLRQYLASISVHDETYCFLRTDSPLIAIEELLLADL